MNRLPRPWLIRRIDNRPDTPTPWRVWQMQDDDTYQLVSEWPTHAEAINATQGVRGS